MESDPTSGGIAWIAAAMTGSVANAVSIIAVAFCGFQMLAGRLPVERMVKVVIGCVLVFGAGSIARALMATLVSGAPVSAAQPAAVISLRPTATTSAPYDPYAGASVGASAASSTGLSSDQRVTVPRN